MLKKMGWEEGEGIGKHKQGDANPLTLEIKFDKKGLMAAEEEKRGSVSFFLYYYSFLPKEFEVRPASLYL
jgi:hypothetical protein